MRDKTRGTPVNRWINKGMTDWLTEWMIEWMKHHSSDIIVGECWQPLVGNRRPPNTTEAPRSGVKPEVLSFSRLNCKRYPVRGPVDGDCLCSDQDGATAQVLQPWTRNMAWPLVQRGARASAVHLPAFWSTSGWRYIMLPSVHISVSSLLPASATSTGFPVYPRCTSIWHKLLSQRRFSTSKAQQGI